MKAAKGANPRVGLFRGLRMAACVSAFFPNAPHAPSRRAPLALTEADIVPRRAVAAIRPLGSADRVGAPAEPVRFPAVRSALWDRTPRGAPVALRPAAPRLTISPQLIALLGDGPAALHAEVRAAGVPPAQPGGLATFDVAVRALAASAAPQSTARAAAATTQPCAIPVAAAAWPGALELRADSSSYTTLLSRAEAAVDGTSALSVGELVPVHGVATRSAVGDAVLLRFEALLPTLALEAVPLHALSVLSSPLSDSLRLPTMRGQLRTGYLTMDQTRRLVLLGESDPKAFETPLVGVWVSGVASLAEPYAWAAAVRYARLDAAVAEAVTTNDGSDAFLVLAYEEVDAEPGGATLPRLYDVSPRSGGSAYRLVGRGMQLTLPVPPATYADLSLDLYACEASEVASLLRTRPAYPREGPAAQPDAPVKDGASSLPAPRPPLALASATAASLTAAAAAAASSEGGEGGEGGGGSDARGGRRPPSLFARVPTMLPALMQREAQVEMAALIAQLQAQVVQLTSRVEQQQELIECLTKERDLARVAPPNQPAPPSPLPSPPDASPSGSAALAPSPPSPPSPPSTGWPAGLDGMGRPQSRRDAALAAAVASVTAESDDDDDDDDDDGERDGAESLVLQVDADEADEAAAASAAATSAAASAVGSYTDGFDDEVPRIQYMPDDDDDDGSGGVVGAAYDEDVANGGGDDGELLPDAGEVFTDGDEEGRATFTAADLAAALAQAEEEREGEAELDEELLEARLAVPLEVDSF